MVFINIKRFGYRYEDNSKDEIAAVTKEMLLRLNGEYIETEEDRFLRQQYRALFPQDHWSYENLTPIGADFLREYQQLLTKRVVSEEEINILIVVPKYSLTPFEYYEFPVGLAYISAALKAQGYRVDALNLNEYYGQLAINDWAPLENVAAP